MDGSRQSPVSLTCLTTAPARSAFPHTACTSNFSESSGRWERFQVLRYGLFAASACALVLATLTTPAPARGPENIADVAEQVIDTVVNIATTQRVTQNRSEPLPQLPETPSDELFRDFFNRRGESRTPGRPINSLGSGFIIDAAGVIVTNQHVIADA